MSSRSYRPLFALNEPSDPNALGGESVAFQGIYFVFADPDPGVATALSVEEEEEAEIGETTPLDAESEPERDAPVRKLKTEDPVVEARVRRCGFFVAAADAAVEANNG